MPITVTKDGSTQTVKDGAVASSVELATHEAKANIHHTASVKPSDTLLNNNDTERTREGNSYAILKETRIHYSGHYRVTFEIKRGAGGAYTVYGKIYKNGSADGTERNTQSTTYVEVTAEDLHFMAGDLIQIYAKCADVAPQAVYIKNFKLKGTVMTDLEDTAGK